MTHKIAIDRIACTGHGLCAELLPERIRLDEWGYPVIDPEPIPGDLVSHVRRAVAACPVLALRAERDPRTDHGSRPRADAGGSRGRG